MTESEPKVPDRSRPASIALALSGGGYRAAAFQLGALRALDDVALLDAVIHLSTASGGTLLGALWLDARARARDKKETFVFTTFETATVDLMARSHVGVLALGALAKQCERHSFIRAAARVYREGFFPERTWPERPSTASGTPSSSSSQAPLPVTLGMIDGLLDEVRFNATDMHTGNDFRFVLGKSRATLGSGAFQMTRDVRDNILLADVVATSSCFPAGFEPMVFPDDFSRSRDGPEVELSDAPSSTTNPQSTEKITSFALMDGGIYDNQAIEALIDMDRQESVKKKTDFVLVVDVDVGVEPLLKPAPAGIWKWLVRLPPFPPLFVVIGLIAAWMSGVATPMRDAVGASLAPLWSVADELALGGFALLIFLVLLRGRWFAVKTVVLLLWLPVPALVRLAERRVTSVLALILRVFMKRVRSTGYGAGSRQFQHRHAREAMSALPDRWVTALLQRRDVQKRSLPMSDDAQAILLRAQKEPTRLWFDNRWQAEGLVLAGRMVTLEALSQEKLDASGIDLKTPWDALMADCTKFETSKSRWRRFFERVTARRG